jgi:CheY-like chemotaxis protein
VRGGEGRGGVSKRVLILSNDVPLRRALSEHLAGGGFDPVLAATAGQGEAALSARVALALIDLALADVDAVHFLREHRRRATPGHRTSFWRRAVKTSASSLPSAPAGAAACTAMTRSGA